MTKTATDIFAEVDRATIKFPTWPTDPLHALAVLGEEYGELNKAVLQSVYEPHKSGPADVREEAIQTAAMAIRFVMSLDAYDYQPGAQHDQKYPMTASSDLVEVSRLFPCPVCVDEYTINGDPASSFCDKHYRQYLATLQIYPEDLHSYRMKALDDFGAISALAKADRPRLEKLIHDQADRILALEADKAALVEELKALQPVFCEYLCGTGISGPPHEPECVKAVATLAKHGGSEADRLSVDTSNEHDTTHSY